jgi:uncharacterized protein (TIGR03382 family)
LKRLLNIAPLALLLPTLASASVVWKGDLETGNTSQWDKEQSVSSNRLMVVTSPVREGKYALKVTVRQGDNPIKASGNRNELVYLSHETPGSEFYYKWSTLFPQSFPRSDKWALFTQWHQEGTSGSPPLEMYVAGDQMKLRVGGSAGKILWTKPLQREHWNDFVLHVKWSSDKKTGFIELYHDGQLAVPKTYMATQFSNQSNYLKLGLYRDASIAQEGVVYHDGFVQTTNREDVLPSTLETETPVVVAPEPAPADPSEGPPDLDDADSTVVQLPTQGGAPATSALVPGSPAYEDGVPAASCGASSTGGMPLLVAGVLTALALASRRKTAAARAPARRR